MEIVKEESQLENGGNEIASQNDGEVTDKTEMSPKPKETGNIVWSVTITSFENGKQDINVQTPSNTSLSENLGTFDIAKAILLKKL